MTDKEKAEMVWLWENIDKLTEAEYKVFCKHIDDINLAEICIHRLYLSVKERCVGEVAE